MQERTNACSLTHSHTDHLYPAELVNRGGCYAHDMNSPTLDLFCNEAVRDYIFRAAGHELEPDVKQRLRFHIAKTFEPIAAGPYTVTPLPVKHMQTEQALIYLIEKGGGRNSGISDYSWDWICTC